MEANTMRSFEGGGIRRIDDLALQAQMFSCGAAMNLLQLGRVLTEARPLVPEGEWIEWVQTNAHLPIRRAQEYMQCFRKFGIDQRIAQLGPSQIIALLPMSDEERETLMAENDVGSMTVKEIREARQCLTAEENGSRSLKPDSRTDTEPGTRKDSQTVCESGHTPSATQAKRNGMKSEPSADTTTAISGDGMRSEPSGTLSAEEKEKMRAEIRAEEKARIETEMSKEMAAVLEDARAEARQYRMEMERLAESAKESMTTANRLVMEKAKMEAEMREQEEILREQQEEMNRANEELLNLKSERARGEAGKQESDELTADTFGRAVGMFMGTVARMPYMHAAFAVMEPKERDTYESLLKTVEGWAAAARQALDSYGAEGGVVV